MKGEVVEAVEESEGEKDGVDNGLETGLWWCEGREAVCEIGAEGCSVKGDRAGDETGGIEKKE